MTQALPANPNLDWLKKTAKQRLVQLRATRPDAQLHHAQLALAGDYGFSSWRALKAHVDGLAPLQRERDRIFAAAQAGDIAAIRAAFAAGFDPATPDRDGRTIYQIAKDLRHEAIELLARDVQGGSNHTRSDAEARAVRDLLTAAQSGDVAGLGAHLDARPDLIDALGGDGFQKVAALHLAVLRNQHAAIALLIARGANLDRRDFPDNAAPLHFAAAHGDLETLRLLVEAGADVAGNGDDYGVGVLGWATCFRSLREDVAAYLLANGATLGIWTAIALDRGDWVRSSVARDRSLLAARMSRNQHRRTPLHHAAAKNRLEVVRLLIALGADPNANDATGATPLTTASQDNADADIAAALLAAGARLDFLSAVYTGRFAEAEAMLREDPQRIGPDGRDTIALHLAVNRKNAATLRWLIAHGIAVDAKRPMWDCNHTALHMTVESGALELAQMLLEAGADPNVRDDKYQSTALGWATFFDRAAFVELLRAHGGMP